MRSMPTASGAGTLGDASQTFVRDRGPFPDRAEGQANLAFRLMLVVRTRTTDLCAILLATIKDSCGASVIMRAKRGSGVLRDEGCIGGLNNSIHGVLLSVLTIRHCPKALVKAWWTRIPGWAACGIELRFGLGTQARLGEQRASRSSLGVGRSPVHVSFRSHQRAAQGTRGKACWPHGERASPRGG